MDYGPSSRVFVLLWPIITPRAVSAAESNAEIKQPFFSICIRLYKIDPELFENIIDSKKVFEIVSIAINVKGIGTNDQVNIQALNARNLISEQPIEVMLNVSQGIEIFDITKLVKWQ